VELERVPTRPPRPALMSLLSAYFPASTESLDKTAKDSDRMAGVARTRLSAGELEGSGRAPLEHDPVIDLAPDAQENGLATMLAELVRQNLAAKPHKKGDFTTLAGRVAIVADDVDVALTLCFERGGRLTIHDGIFGIPDVTIRGPSEVIMALSNLPIAKGLGLPIPDPRDREAVQTFGAVVGAVRQGKLHVYGMVFHPILVMRLTRVMSIHG
jgi:hypothetical protein